MRMEKLLRMFWNVIRFLYHIHYVFFVTPATFIFTYIHTIYLYNKHEWEIERNAIYIK